MLCFFAAPTDIHTLHGVRGVRFVEQTDPGRASLLPRRTFNELTGREMLGFVFRLIRDVLHTQTGVQRDYGPRGRGFCVRTDPGCASSLARPRSNERAGRAASVFVF